MELTQWICVILCTFVCPGGGVQSVWNVRTDQEIGHMYNIFPNYMFKDSFVSMSIVCFAKNPTNLTIVWTFREVHCMEQMYEGNLDEDIEIAVLENQVLSQQKKSHKKMLKSGPNVGNDTNSAVDTGMPDMYVRHRNRTAPPDSVLSRPPIAYQMSKSTHTCHHHNIIKLMDESTSPYRQLTFPAGWTNPKVETVERPQRHGVEIEQRVVSAWEDGMYHFELAIIPDGHNKNQDRKYKAQATVEMHGQYGYLTAIDWPLLPYNGVMSFLYLVLSTVWIMIWARSHRFTLKIHVGMGLVAVAGSMSHTLVFIQHAAENSNGGGAALIMWFAEVLSCVQIAFLNFVLMVVSTGYGINTPTLARRTLVLMGLVCGVQFALGLTWVVVTDSALRLQYEYPTFTKGVLWCKVALFVIIAAWIMISAIRTLIHLRLRRHAGIKIVTFTSFMVSCIIAFLIHMVVFVLGMGWMQACRTNWQIQWVFHSISHMEAFVLLAILMVLWRPVDTAQSYAFAPLGMDGLEDSQDEDDNDEDEVFIKETEKFKLDEL